MSSSPLPPRSIGAARSDSDVGERPAQSKDVLVRTLSADGGVAVRAFVGTTLVHEATSRHAMAPTARAALGRALLGAVLLAVGGKDRESVQLELRGDGPLRSLVAMSDPLGRARGYVANPAAHPPLRADGRLDVAAAIGIGLLTVSRRRPDWPAPHSGTVHLVASEIAQDLTHYLLESEQVHSAVSLGAAIDRAGEVEAAAGFLVQVLPGAEDAPLERIERNVRAMGSTAAEVRDGTSADDLVDALLDGVGSRERHRESPIFFCPCDRGRALRTLSLLGRAELEEIAASEEGQEVCCQFCGERYQLGPTEVRDLLGRA